MSEVIIFAFGCFVTVAVAFAVGSLVYVASKEPVERPPVSS